MNPAYDFKSKLMSRESGGTYVSKPGKNACMTSNHKSLHICFLIVTGGILNSTRLWMKKGSLS